MASFYRSTVEQFLSSAESEILADLSIAYANRGFTSQFTDQTLTWERDLHSLRAALSKCVDTCPDARYWGILLEFSIPRKEKRIDVVLLAGKAIVVLEAKTESASLQDQRQLEEYALLLHYFHKASDQKRIIPVLVSPTFEAPSFDRIDQCEMFPQLSA